MSNSNKKRKCSKIRYRTEEQAQNTLNGIRAIREYRRITEREGFEKRNERRVYLCPFCRGYHLTSHDNSLNELKEKKKAAEIKKQNRLKKARAAEEVQEEKERLEWLDSLLEGESAFEILN